MNTVVKTKPRNLPALWPEGFPRVMDWFENMVPLDTPWRFSNMHSMKIEEFMREGELIVRAELPGVDPDKDIDVTIGDGLLTIHGERKEEHQGEQRSEFYYGTFSRTLSLPSGVDESKVVAEYKNGILEVRIGVVQQPEAPTHIPIKHQK